MPSAGNETTAAKIETSNEISSFDDAVNAVKSGKVEPKAASDTLLSLLSLDERLWLLDGDEEFWPGIYSMMTQGFGHRPYVMGEIERLKIPGVRFSDGPRGCTMGESTAFPVPMARGASWDVSLEERVGRAIGRECKALGANFFSGICVNLPRHPGWGRVQETYSEDPIILGEMGAAIARGVQENLIACVKHYALNSMENARFKVDVSVNDDVLHEVYLSQFRHIVEQGVGSVMSSYNSVRGHFAGESRELLIDILRHQWGFNGFVISDFLFGFRNVPASLRNGLDLEAPFRQQRALHLKPALEDGKVTAEDVDRAASNILRTLIKNEAFRGDSKPTADVVFSEEHRSLARESAAKSMVLLKNETIDGAAMLPFRPDTSKVAVVGWLADSKNTGDKGSSAVRSPEVISPYQGIKDALPNADVALENSTDIDAVKRAAAAADVVVVVVGYDFRDEGEYTAPAFNGTPALKPVIPPDDGSEGAKAVTERLMKPAPNKEDTGKDNYGFGAGGDRVRMRLRPEDVEVVKAAVEVNPRTIVSIVAGGAVIIEEWKDLPAAIIFSFYSGCQGGRALADLLLGRADFSGRLPFSIPTSERHLLAFDNNAETIKYDRWFGQRLLDRLQVKASYPLGFGLSYTTFSISSLEVQRITMSEDQLLVHLLVSNTGARDGRYVAQVYGLVDVPDWPIRSLLGFSAQDIKGGEQKVVEIIVSTRPLQRWRQGSWALVAKSIAIEVGRFSGDSESLQAMVDVTPVSNV
ncbi:glycoside hydrolase superfamily [Dactylonectria macrodidyma]|uniref:beta-glucosidase n=1 Tax=Dactylonectria macrodidyma TaxID=307937 RepID=A0A9P9IZQ9_9HYPO|nr:glycoside hydrolase superfamily [Dactylonectria macrodidyma]